MRKDNIWDDIRTKEVAAKLAGPKPPSNPLLAVITDSTTIEETLSRRMILARQRTARMVAARRLGPVTGARALLAALKK